MPDGSAMTQSTTTSTRSLRASWAGRTGDEPVISRMKGAVPESGTPRASRSRSRSPMVSLPSSCRVRATSRAEVSGPAGITTREDHSSLCRVNHSCWRETGGPLPPDWVSPDTSSASSTLIARLMLPDVLSMPLAGGPRSHRTVVSPHRGLSKPRSSGRGRPSPRTRPAHPGWRGLSLRRLGQASEHRDPEDLFHLPVLQHPARPEVGQSRGEDGQEHGGNGPHAEDHRQLGVHRTSGKHGGPDHTVPVLECRLGRVELDLGAVYPVLQ